MIDNKDKPAFAHSCTTANGETHSIETGLTKREYFAAMAMQGLLANPSLLKESYNELTECAIKHCDSILKALEETK